MSKTKSFAEIELDILSASITDPENRPIIEEFREEILALCEKFGNSGQSGGSAPYVASALSSAIGKLLLFKPICPITGLDEEWADVSEMSNEPTLQNKRLLSIFKNKDGSAYYLNAIVFRGENEGSSFTGNSVQLANGNTIGSRQYIKSYPFEPKTFYIDVVETEWANKEETEKKQGGGWWTSVVKDESQLDAVWEYYVKPSSVS